MSINFKSLADVDLLNAMPENANVIIEVDGATRRAPKEDGIGKLVAVESLDKVPEGATILIEVDGEIKRVPSDGLGGKSDAWDVVIGYDGYTGEYIWAKGDHTTLIEMLVAGQWPRVCIASTNGDISRPEAFMETALDIELSSGSGTWIDILFRIGHLNINCGDGSITRFANDE